MKMYIGTKVIKSRVMNRGDYNEHRGWDIQKNENPDFSRTQMEKETIFRKLRACGGRITAQRKILLDIILEEERYAADYND